MRLSQVKLNLQVQLMDGLPCCFAADMSKLKVGFGDDGDTDLASIIIKHQNAQTCDGRSCQTFYCTL